MIVLGDDYEVVVKPSGLKYVKILNANVLLSEAKEVALDQFPGVQDSNLQLEVSDDGHLVLLAVN